MQCSRNVILYMDYAKLCKLCKTYVNYVSLQKYANHDCALASPYLLMSKSVALEAGLLQLENCALPPHLHCSAREQELTFIRNSLLNLICLTDLYTDLWFTPLPCRTFGRIPRPGRPYVRLSR